MYQQTGLTIQDTASSLFDVLLPFITFVAIPFIVYIIYKVYANAMSGQSFNNYKGSGDYCEDDEPVETTEGYPEDKKIQQDDSIVAIEQETSSQIVLSKGTIQFPSTVKLDK